MIRDFSFLFTEIEKQNDQYSGRFEFFFKEGTCLEDVEKIGIVHFSFRNLENEERDDREKKIRIK